MNVTRNTIRPRIRYVNVLNAFVYRGIVSAVTTPLPELSRRRAKTRGKLLDAARDVFADRGVLGGSVEEICERAGFTRGAFYSNFDDKDELIVAVLDREEDAIVQRLADTIELGPSTDMGAVTAAISHYLDTEPIDQRYFLIMTELALHAIRDPKTAALFLKLQNASKERTTDLIETGMAAVGRSLTVTAADAADVVLAIIERSNRRAFIEPEQHERRSLAEASITKVLLGLSVAKDDAASDGASK